MTKLQRTIWTRKRCRDNKVHCDIGEAPCGEVYSQSRQFDRIAKRCLGISFALLLPVSVSAFESGSNGSDGPLEFMTPGVVEFNPSVQNIDRDGDGIFHFTTFRVGPGVTVKMTAKFLNGPVHILASGDITIEGIIDLNGQDGQFGSSVLGRSFRALSIPGAGGFPGGMGRFENDPPKPGFGPGAGGAALDPEVRPNGSGAGHSQVGDQAGPSGVPAGRIYGNPLLIPLVGGSGGGGGWSVARGAIAGGGGGAGGGAILLASSTSISVTGTITAAGGIGGEDAPRSGTSGAGGGGSSGAIRLVAPTITGSGKILAPDNRTRNFGIGYAPGWIRLEANNQNFTGELNPRAQFGTPYGIFFAKQPTIRAVTVDGQSVVTTPTGSFEFPDVTINNASPVVVQIAAKNVPLGTVPKLHVYAENGPDQVVDASPLTGTSDSSTASATVTLPPGLARGIVRASWSP